MLSSFEYQHEGHYFTFSERAQLKAQHNCIQGDRSQDETGVRRYIESRSRKWWIC